MRRDRLTFAMMIGIPLLQLMLFGYAINSDPRHLPAAVLLADHGPQGRTLLARDAEQHLFRFRAAGENGSAKDATCSRAARCSSSSTFPQNFTRDLLRGDRPALLVEADATDPAATGNALGSFGTLLDTALAKRSQRPARVCCNAPAARSICAFTRSTTRRAITQYNIVPGPDGRDPDHDDDHDHRPGDHARARARHDGKSALHADATARSADRQDRALHRRRLRPGRGHSRRRATFSSTCRCWAASRCCWSSRSSSSPPTSRWASPSRRSRRTSCRRCR